MNIAIYTLDFTWAGGIDLLHGIVKGLLTQKRKPVKVYILIHDSTIEEPWTPSVKQNLKLVVRSVKKARKKIIKAIRREKAVEETAADFSHADYILEIFAKENVECVYYNDWGIRQLEHVLSQIKADVVLPFLNARFNKESKFPHVGYMFDFVYKHRSELYTPQFCLETDIRYANTLLNSKAILVNSKSVQNDVRQYFPYADAKIFAMPFAPYANTETYGQALSLDDIKTKYSIRKRYFMISNQFWLHKSHETAFDALAHLHKEYNQKDVCLICTGRMTDLSGTDERKKQLQKYIADLGLTDDVFFLGHVSKVDQLALMLKSEGLIQPTTFEGGPGGGSVYMSVANGVPAIVSDIPVNKEIGDSELVTFFRVKDHIDLAGKMKDQLTKGFVRLTADAVTEKNSDQLSLLGNTIMDCIDFVTNKTEERK